MSRTVRYLSASAAISADRVYRYSLMRRWANTAERKLVVIGLNPSTADAMKDDPTIRRCVGFAKRERCSGLVMLNLYGLRSTDPAALWSHLDPVGPGNDAAIVENVWPGDVLLAAWGANARDPDRVAAVVDLLDGLRCIDGGADGQPHRLPPLLCLGTTKAGHPRHPLYVRADTPLQPWDGAA